MHYKRLMRNGTAEHETCVECGKSLNASNKLGYCRAHRWIYDSRTAKAIAKRKAKWRNLSHEQKLVARARNSIDSATWRARHAERKRQINLNWDKKNPERRREINKRCRDNSRATVSGLLKHRMSTRLRAALREKKAGRSWEKLVGFTLADLAAHLEAQFYDGMSWDRFHKGEIHIDHIRPISMFLIESEGDDEFRKCWSLSNLQPLWAKDHHKKSALESTLRAKCDRIRERHELTKRRREVRLL